MQIYLGKTGLDATFQDSFPKKTKCYKCGKDAKIMFVAQEWDEKEYVCNLHRTTGKEGGLWFHDAVSVALYACSHCLEVTALANQA